MRLSLVLLSLATSISLLISAAQAEPNITTIRYAVVREGAPIGSSTLTLRRNGEDTIADVATHVAVKFAFITVYRFDQTETEHWHGDRLLTLNAVTNDNGTVHRVTAHAAGNALIVDADGKSSRLDAEVMPASLWNASLVRRTMALNLQTGDLTPVSVIDRGSEQLVLQGRPTTTHHYSINTSFPQDVWYDQQHRLVKVEMRGSDGSTIRYQPG